MNLSKSLKCAGAIAVLMMHASGVNALSVPMITLPDVFGEATEVVLAVQDGRQPSVGKIKTNQRLFTVSRVWKSQAGIRPGDKIAVCNTGSDTDEFFDREPCFFAEEDYSSYLHWLGDLTPPALPGDIYSDAAHTD